MFDQIIYIFFSIDSSEYWYFCSVLPNMLNLIYPYVCQNHVQFQADYHHLAAGCMCIMVYFHTHSPITFFFPFYRSYWAGICVQEHSKCTSARQVGMCVLVLSTLMQHLSIHQLPLWPSLHYFTRQIEQVFLHSWKLWLTLASTTLWTSLFCMAQVQPKSQLLKTFPLCNDCKKKPVTKSLGQCCTAWTSTFLTPKLPVPTFSMPFPCLFDLNTHAEYALP